MKRFNPDFDINKDYGEQGEDGFRAILGLKDASFEVKRKTRLDDKFYVEVAQSPQASGVYKRSGINTTKATHWVYAIADLGVYVIVPTALLKGCARVHGAPVSETDGDNPTKGRLVSLGQIVKPAQSEAA